MAQVVIVSGGSRGLGLFLVKHLLSKDCIVCTFARKSTKEVEGISRSNPDNFLFRPFDSRDFQSMKSFIGEVIEKFGRIDGLVNNAAIGQDHLLVHMSNEIAKEIIEVNLLAPVMITKEVVKQMMLQGGGRIVTISSICGSRGYPGLAVYSATKGALDSFSRSLARELGERSISVNTIAPGFFESEMSSVLLPEQLATIKRRTPTKKLTNEADITPILDLLLLGNSNISGETIFVDGGISI